MKIELNKKDFESLITLLKTREINIDVSSMYLYYLMNESASIKEKNIQKWMNNRKLSVDRAFYYEFLNVLELDHKDEDYINANKTCNISNIKLLNENDYLNNPYYKTIKVPEAKSKSWYFKIDTINAYEGFMYDDLKVNKDNNYAEISSFGFFNKPYKYLSVTQGEDIWMCVTPHEINTMAPSIKEASGNVLVYGLGLGYFPFMVSNKNDCKKITIIEKDQNAIDLFKNYILPQFPHKEKIEVINEDAFKYDFTKGNYNYAFIDLWHNVDDGISLYIKMKHLFKDHKEIKTSYWIETSLLVYLRRLLLTLIDEIADNATEENYTHEENYDDHIINRMYQILKDKDFKTFKEIYDLLDDESLRLIAELI